MLKINVNKIKLSKVRMSKQIIEISVFIRWLFLGDVGMFNFFYFD
jgi:hypothetical protein